MFQSILNKKSINLNQQNETRITNFSFSSLEQISVLALQYFSEGPKIVYLTGLKQEDLTKEQLDIIQNSKNLVLDSRFGKPAI